MPPFRPYMVADMKTGLASARDPWLLPQDAFVELNNCELFQGVLQKRLGRKQFGQIFHRVLSEMIDTSPDGADVTFSGTLAVKPLTSDSIIITATQTGGLIETITPSVADATVLEGDDAAVGTINYTSGVWTLDFTASAAPPGNGSEIVATYIDATAPGEGIMGIKNYYDGTTETTLAFDYTRATKYDATAATLLDLTRLKLHFKHGGVQDTAPVIGDVCTGGTTGATATVEQVVTDHGTLGGGDADGWIILKNGTMENGDFQTGEQLEDGAGGIYGVADGIQVDNEFTLDDTTDANFFWMENTDFTSSNGGNLAYITNDKDGIQKYDGDTLVPFYIDLDVEGGPDNDVNTCRIIVEYKQQLMLLNTQERGTRYPQRARWLSAGAPGTAIAASWVDAPTNDTIVGAAFVREDLVVFFQGAIRNSTWRLAYTGDTTLPFRWERISSRFGSVAKNSVVNLGDRLVSMDSARIITSDNRNTIPVDAKIPDFVQTSNMGAIKYSNALMVEENRQFYLSFTTSSEDKPDSLLVGNFDDDNWSIYTHPVHTLGFTTATSDLILDTIETILDTIDESFDTPSTREGFPIVLMGRRDGIIDQLNTTSQDSGSDFAWNAKSGEWNPYSKQGLRARLGRISFMYDVDADVSFDVEFFVEGSNTPYKTQTITCDGVGSKAVKTIYCNAVSDFHQINIKDDGSGLRTRLHYVEPWFKSAGVMR